MTGNADNPRIMHKAIVFMLTTVDVAGLPLLLEGTNFSNMRFTQAQLAAILIFDKLTSFSSSLASELTTIAGEMI